MQVHNPPTSRTEGGGDGHVEPVLAIAGECYQGLSQPLLEQMLYLVYKLSLMLPLSAMGCSGFLFKFTLSRAASSGVGGNWSVSSPGSKPKDGSSSPERVAAKQNQEMQANRSSLRNTKDNARGS